jgi:hypothetical protein
MTAQEDQARLRKQRTRSIAIALGLALLVIIFYATTIVRFGLNHGQGTP